MANTFQNPFHLSHFIDVQRLNPDAIELIFDLALRFKHNHCQPLLKGKLIASCFFEASTRTRLSFDAAVYRLGGQVIGFSKGSSTSSVKGESLADSMRVISAYADAIILRHPKNGAAIEAANAANIPVINAGDGTNQHPTQTLIDLFSIKEAQGRLHGLSIAMVGDLKYGRTIHSLVETVALFGMRLFFVAPAELTISQSICEVLDKKGLKFSHHDNINDIIDKVDVLYMTRFQRERFLQGEEQEPDAKLTITPKLLQSAKASLSILHPLPRQSELPPAVDTTQHAYYFQQAENALYIRQALLALILADQKDIISWLTN